MRVIFILLILVPSAFSYASPPCGISYKVVDASSNMEGVLSKLSNIKYTNKQELNEIHITLPNELHGAKISTLSLELEVGGKPKLVVSVEPYYRSTEDSSYVISVHEEFSPQLKLAVVYNFLKKCGKEEVASKGFRYHLKKP